MIAPTQPGIQMTQVPPTLSYASPMSGSCPLCQTRPISKKSIYGHPVCKKCFYKYANRRQLDYLGDAIVFIIPNMLIIGAVTFALLHSGVSEISTQVIDFVLGLGLACIFCFRDSINGRSPGKWMTNLQVVNEADNQPISFGQSFKRNCVLLIGQVPFVGPFVVFVIVIVIAVQVGSGYRIGDRFAKTKVIWLKYANSPVFGGNPMLCKGCGYNLLGNVSGVCPECGKPIEAVLPGVVV